MDVYIAYYNVIIIISLFPVLELDENLEKILYQSTNTVLLFWDCSI